MERKNIKVIIFDVGGVLLKGSFIGFINEAYKILGLNKKFEAKEEIVFDAEYNKGNILVEECFKSFFGESVLRGNNMQKILNLWQQTWKPNRNVYKLVQNLKINNYFLAILSNSDKINSENYKKKGWYDLFDEVILSHELGVIKPGIKIYKILLRRINFLPRECVFIDDQKKCLETAKKMGMNTILFESSEQLEKELEKLNINFKSERDKN